MPASNCYAVQFPIYQPAMRIITAISNTNPAQITTSFAHQYVNGIIVRLDIPQANGMPQINGTPYPGQTFPITVTGLTTFTVPVDATKFQTYVNNECCCVVPVGENTDMLRNATRNVLPYSAI